VRARIAVLAVLGALAAAPAAHAWTPDVSSARSYAKQRAGDVSFAVRTEGSLYGYRGRRTVPSASVVKAMLMVAYLNHRTVRGRRLRAGDRALLVPMVRWSNNVTASRVRDYVGNSALARLARRVGMRRFRTAPSWGSSVIDAVDQTRLFLKVDRYVVRRHRAYAMRLLNTIVPSQRWGVARARPADLSQVAAVTPESTAMAKELKRRGFRFVGPTTAYALMQATGMVDDHVVNCWVPRLSE